MINDREPAHPARTSTARPACPRCDYDLAGQVAAWTTRCPLDGTCPECGLAFAWRDVLVAGALPPRWCFEHVARAGTLIKTHIRTLRPKWLFSSLAMHHDVKVRRLTLFLPFGLLLTVAVQSTLLFTLHALARLFHAILTAIEQPRWPYEHQTWVEIAGRVAWPWSATRHTGVDFSAFDNRVYDWWVEDLLMGVDAVPLTAAFCIAALMPLLFFLVPFTRRRYKVRPRHLLRLALLSSVWLPLVVAVNGIMLALVELAGFALPLVGIDIGVWEVESFVYGGGWYRSWVEVAAVFLAISIYMLLWWRGAIARYLRIPHAFAIAACFLAIAWAISLLAMLATPGAPAYLRWTV